MAYLGPQDDKRSFFRDEPGWTLGLPFTLGIPTQPLADAARWRKGFDFRRYHKALGDVTPADVLHGRREEILRRRKEVKAAAIQSRRQYDQGLRRLVYPS